jgi:hypothetical protein
MPATALPLLPSSQVPKEDSLIRLLYLPLEKCKWKAEYDGNVQTSTEYWRGISFNLKEPQIVSHIRFVPKNEDNRVRIGDFYILSEWDGNEWKKLLAKKADLNYIHAEGLVPGRMYWLCNKSNGKEELPFVVTKNGEQKFIHEDLLRILQQ